MKTYVSTSSPYPTANTRARRRRKLDDKDAPPHASHFFDKGGQAAMFAGWLGFQPGEGRAGKPAALAGWKPAPGVWILAGWKPALPTGIWCALLAVLPLNAQVTQDLPYDSGTTGADGPLTFRQILYGGRYRHALAYDTNRHEVVMFGGYNVGNDTWVFDGTNWLQRTPATAPAARYDHAMAYDEIHQRVVLFGGYRPDRNVRTNETWSWDGANWTLMTPTNPPSSRYGSKMVYNRAMGQILLYGGYDGNYRNDTWTWDGTNWTQLNPPGAPVADSGDYYSMAYDEARQQVVLLYGNSNPARTFVWDGSTWSEKSPDTKPSRRQAQIMAYDPNLAKVILFGGQACCWPDINETWSWDGTNWVVLSPSAAPSVRSLSAMVLDSTRRKLVLFSGDNVAADTWLWDGVTWSYWSGPSQTFDMRSRPGGIWNFTSIDVPPYITVSFIKNAANTPVQWIASSNVTINGTLNLNGQDALGNVLPGNEAVGGPGGFASGLGGQRFNQSSSYAGTPGQGPGGGTPGTTSAANGGDATGPSSYGNVYLQPLIGGSGGGGTGSYDTADGANGGGGGGAILITSSRDITVNGSIQANGGSRAQVCCPWTYAGYGSGGEIRLVADRVTLNGSLQANSYGRIRVEAYYRYGMNNTVPPGLISAPVATQSFQSNVVLLISSVAGQNVVQPPGGSTVNPDVVFSQTGPITVIVQGQNLPDGTPVTLRVTTSGGIITKPGTNDPPVTLGSGTATFSNIVVPAGPGTIQASATFTVNSH